MMKKIIAIIIVILLTVAAGVYYAYENKDVSPFSKEVNGVAIFKDRNSVHLRVAAKLGIEPLENRKEVKTVKDLLVQIESNDRYKVDWLTHSVPYLTHGARSLLEQIGQNFQDSLSARGYEKHRIIVTSVLRTRDDVMRLRKSGNPNAVMNSAHMHGTTFDITYARYDRMFSLKSVVRKRPSHKEMKTILSEVLKDLRIGQKCYIMYEVKQRCFHITSRI